MIYLTWGAEPVEDGHDFYRTAFTNNMVCAHCNLVPLDQEDVESDCGPTDLDYELEFEYLVYEDFVGNVLGQFPSVVPADDWIGNENHVVAENHFARFGVSEYCGLMALWVVPVEDDGWGGPSFEGLSRHWIDQIWPKVEEMYPSRLVPLGTMSNGVTVYERRTA